MHAALPTVPRPAFNGQAVGANTLRLSLVTAWRAQTAQGVEKLARVLFLPVESAPPGVFPAGLRPSLSKSSAASCWLERTLKGVCPAALASS